MMHMTFYWGKNVTILIDQWRVNTWTGYLLSLIFLFLFATFYQYMDSIRSRLQTLPSKSSDQSQPSFQIPLINRQSGGLKVSTVGRLAASVVFCVNSVIGYLLMLAVMSFNGGVFIAVVVGLAVGYFVFRSHGDVSETNETSSCACA